MDNNDSNEASNFDYGTTTSECDDDEDTTMCTTVLPAKARATLLARRSVVANA